MGDQYEPIGQRVYFEDYLLRKATVEDTMALTLEARIALQILDRALTAGVQGPEDSQGRATVVLQTPEQAVGRAFEAAELACREMRKRGWLTSVPEPKAREELASRLVEAQAAQTK